MKILNSIEVHGIILKPNDKVEISLTLATGSEGKLESHFVNGQIVKIEELFFDTPMITIRRDEGPVDEFDDGMVAISPEWIVNVEVLG